MWMELASGQRIVCGQYMVVDINERRNSIESVVFSNFMVTDETRVRLQWMKPWFNLAFEHRVVDANYG